MELSRRLANNILLEPTSCLGNKEVQKVSLLSFFFPDSSLSSKVLPSVSIVGKVVLLHFLCRE